VVRIPTQEQVIVSRGGKGNQVEHEIKISNPVYVSGFEAHHGTLYLGRGGELKYLSG